MTNSLFDLDLRPVSRIVWTLAVVCTCFWRTPSQAATPPNQFDRLRNLARLPRIELRPALAFNPFNGFDLLYDVTAIKRETDTLKQSLAEYSSDAVQHARLGRLCRELGNTEAAQEAFSAAVRLFGQQGAENSDDGKVLAAYGEALEGTGRHEDAERVLQAASRSAGSQWQTHYAMGRFLVRRAVRLSLPAAKSGAESGIELIWLGGAISLVSDPRSIEQALEDVARAMACFDRAVDLAPSEAEVHAWRAAAKSVRSWLVVLQKGQEDSARDSAGLIGAIFPRDALSDVRETARLAPRNSRALALSALWEILCASDSAGTSGRGGSFLQNSWNTIPENVRASVRATVGHLDVLAQRDEPRTAAAALEMLGSIQLLVLKDRAGAETSLRRAAFLDPERDQETLVALLVNAEHWNELTTVAESLVNRADNVRNRLLLAKSLERANHLDRMFQVVWDTHRRFPEDFHANVALAAALVRVSNATIAWTQAESLLSRAEKAAGNSPSRSQIVELFFLRGLLLALTEQPEQARAFLRRAFELDPECDEARQAIEILDFAG